MESSPIVEQVMVEKINSTYCSFRRYNGNGDVLLTLVVSRHVVWEIVDLYVPLGHSRLGIALASLLYIRVLRVSEVAQLHWRDVLDAEEGAGLARVERSKTDQEGDGAYVAITPDALKILELLRRDSGAQVDDELVVGLSKSQISKCVGLDLSMARRHAPLRAVQTHGRWKSPQMLAQYTRAEKALQALE